MRLDQFNNEQFDRGRPVWLEALWIVCQNLLFSSGIPGSGWRCRLLRLFGAKVATGVVIKPHVRIKFPWKLELHEYCWLGENAWLDNLDWIRVGAHVCISQGAYLCTGNHNWASPQFDLITGEIRIEASCWIGAFAKVGPGITLAPGSVITMGSVLSQSTNPDGIYAGNPAQVIAQRKGHNA